MKITAIIITTLILSSCVTQYEYAKNIDECYNHQVENKVGMEYYKNPLRPCYEKNVVGQDFPNLKFTTDQNELIELISINKPIVLIVIDRFYKAGVDLGKNLTTSVEKYDDKVEFIVICSELNLNNNLLYKTKGILPETYIDFNKSVKLITYKKDDVQETGRTNLIKNIKCAGTPMTYFLSKDLKIVDLETIEDIMASDNMIYKEYGKVSNDSIQMFKVSEFEKRIDKLIQ